MATPDEPELFGLPRNGGADQSDRARRDVLDDPPGGDGVDVRFAGA